MRVGAHFSAAFEIRIEGLNDRRQIALRNVVKSEQFDAHGLAELGHAPVDEDLVE